MMKLNPDLAQHVLTDKPNTKIEPCRTCGRPCVVTKFMAAIKVACNECRPKSEDTGRPIRAQGLTPEKAGNLVDLLRNKSFAHAICPFDAEHETELKTISWSEHYGPRRFQGYGRGGIPMYDTEPGETAMHQCKECACVMTMSTQHPLQYQRVNEPRISTEVDPGWAALLGVRRKGRAES